MDNSMECELIGGCLDGRKIPIDTRYSVPETLTMKMPKPITVIVGGALDKHCSRVVYKRSGIVGDRILFRFSGYIE